MAQVQNNDREKLAAFEEAEAKKEKRNKVLKNIGYGVLAVAAGAGAWAACEYFWGDQDWSRQNRTAGNDNNGSDAADAALASTYDYTGV